MNVLLISREYPPFVGGGIGTYTLQYARALAGAGHGAVVVTVSRDGLVHREQDGPVTVVRLPFLDGDDWSAPHPNIRSPATLAAFRRYHPVSVFAMQVAEALPGLVHDYGIDAIEAPDCGALAWFALRARRLGRGWSRPDRHVPLTLFIHSPTAWIEQYNGGRDRSRAGAALRRMERQCLRWCDGLVSPTQALADWVRHRLVDRAVEVVPCPLGDLELTARAAEERPAAAGPAGAEAEFLYVGRLEPRKGVDTLLAGFSRLVGRGEAARLTLAGRDTHDPRTGRLFGAGCLAGLPADARAHVRAVGQRAAEELPALRTTSTAAVVPAPMDNFPYACVEAMAHGQVVIAARAGGMAEMIRDGRDGVLFRPGDADSCAEALGRVVRMSPSQRAELGRSAARRILELAGRDAVIPRRIAHYSRVRPATGADRSWLWWRRSPRAVSVGASGSGRG